jgi:hypothetical protein
MDRLRQHIYTRRRELVAVALFAGVVGLLSILANVDGLVDGEWVAGARIALGLLGIIGAVLVWVRPGGSLAWMLLAAWGLIQIPVVAWSEVGSPTEQFVRFPLSVTNRTTVNGVVTEYSEYGINLVAVVFVIVLFRWRSAIERGHRVETPAIIP